MGWIGKKGRQKRTGDIEILANALAAGDIPVSDGLCLCGYNDGPSGKLGMNKRGCN